MENNNLSFISCNVKGIQQSSKRIKIFEYLRNNQNRFCFFQETQSSVEDEKQWSDNFKGKLFYSHGATKFCGAAFAFLGSKVLEVVGTKNNRGRIFIFDIKICDKELILVNNEKH